MCYNGPSPDQIAADLRSISLLQSWLTPGQREQFDVLGYFEVIGGDSGLRYRINRPTVYNVDVFCECGGVMKRICFVPLDPAIKAHGDIMLMQKMALEKDEAATLKIANTGFGGRVGPLTFYVRGQSFSY